MDAESLARQLQSLPDAELLVAVAVQQNTTGQSVSPNFEMMEDGPAAAVHWFDSDQDAASQFDVFAQSCDGGLFAYWKCQTTAPIVYLASECEGSRVIASGVCEFLSLIAFGSDDYVIDIEYVDQDEQWEGPEEIPDSLEAFRQWLESAFQIQPATSPMAIIKNAMSTSPDLMEWIRQWQKQKYGP